jgi:hypothetical protein
MYLKTLIEDEEDCDEKEKELQQMTIKKKDQVLVLQEDIYSLTYVALIKVNDPILHKSLEIKCILTFFI